MRFELTKPCLDLLVKIVFYATLLRLLYCSVVFELPASFGVIADYDNLWLEIPGRPGP